MKAPESHHQTASTAHAKRAEASEMLGATPGEKQDGDVSRQHQNREELEKAYNEAKKSEARLRKILDTIPTLAWCNLPDGSNDFVNQRWSDYTGLSQEEVKRVGCKVAIHPEDLPNWLDEWRTLVASGEGGEIEARLRRHDGAYRWFLIRVEPLQAESGEMVRWYGTNTDIEDRKRAEEKLRQDERELRRITDAIPQTIIVQGPDGSPIYANQAVLDYTGLTLEDVMTSDYRARIFHPEDLERLREEREAALARGLPFEIEQRALSKDGQYRWFLIRYNPSMTNKDSSSAGTRREPTSMFERGPKTGRETKTSRYGKKSNALQCSKKSLALPKDCVRCWRKCQKWLPLILRS
jgi:PAS domain S-box-containing protein